MENSLPVAVVIPTFNERDNIPHLLKDIFSLHMPNLFAVVVDDSSPDGTGAVADELAKTYPLYVIHRQKKEGLGKAYIHAFKEILSPEFPKKPAYVIQMDADLSHNPNAIPRFLEKIEGCDVVLGSRYIKGGGIENWGRLRHLISRLGNAYATLVLDLVQRDVTSGYKCFRREVLEHLDLDVLSSVGYNFQIETTYKAFKKGYAIAEIPIVFTERRTGSSKFNVGIIIESFIRVLMLRFRK